jgi:hypothetical protein
MKVNILVNCQYYENYNVGPDGFGEVPYWKPKGGHTFKMPIDSDILMYIESSDLVNAINVLVEKQNNVASRFEYIDHEIQWSKPDLVEGLQEEIKKSVLV